MEEQAITDAMVMSADVRNPKIQGQDYGRNVIQLPVSLSIRKRPVGNLRE